MATDEGVGTCIGFALVVRFPTRPRRPLDPSLDFYARAWGHLLLRVLLSGFRNSRADRPHGILPASEYLQALSERFGHASYWYAPTLLWLSSGSHMLRALLGGHDRFAFACLEYLAARHAGHLFCVLLSFVSAAQDFSAYQSDGMLLERVPWDVFAPGGFGRLGRRKQTFACEPLPAGMGCFRIYFRIGRGERS